MRGMLQQNVMSAGRCDPQLVIRVRDGSIQYSVLSAGRCDPQLVIRVRDGSIQYSVLNSQYAMAVFSDQ